MFHVSRHQERSTGILDAQMYATVKQQERIIP